MNTQEISQLFDAFAMDRTYWKDFLEAELGKFVGMGRGAVSIDLVDGDEHRFAAATEACGGFAIKRDDAFLHIDDEDDEVGGFDSELDLFERGFRDDVGCLFPTEQANAAGIDECERLAMPFGFGADAIARDAGLIVDDGNAPPNDPVEERRLADVRATDDGDESRHN